MEDMGRESVKWKDVYDGLEQDWARDRLSEEAQCVETVTGKFPT